MGPIPAAGGDSKQGASVMQWLARHGWQGCLMSQVVKDYLLSFAQQKVCSFVVRTWQYLK